jgi:tetratricopeptide (TPR) repeat protein
MGTQLYEAHMQTLSDMLGEQKYSKAKEFAEANGLVPCTIKLHDLGAIDSDCASMCLSMIGTALYETKKTSEALDIYYKALAFSPAADISYRICINISSCLRHCLVNHQKHVDILQRAISLDDMPLKEKHEALNRLAVCFAKVMQVHRAYRAIQFAKKHGCGTLSEKAIRDNHFTFEFFLTDRDQARTIINSEYRACEVCNLSAKKKDRKLYCCGRCLSAYYCSKKCQVDDWEKGRHKDVCKKKRKK